jgi:RNA polymerase sigma factor (sigma-70 family)
VKEYAPRKVFVLENGEYIELTNEEFEHRKVTDPSYADKLFLPVQGYLMETDRTHYTEFYRDKERQRYLKKLDEIHGLLSIDAFDNEDDNGTDYIQIESDDVADTVAHAMLVEKLRSVIYMLTEEEKELINLHFYLSIPQTEIAKHMGMSQQAVSKRIRKICAKLKKMLDP